MAQILNFPAPDAGYHCGDKNCIACNEFVDTPLVLSDPAAVVAELMQEWRHLRDDDSLEASKRKVELNAELSKYGVFFLTVMGVRQSD